MKWKDSDEDTIEANGGGDLSFDGNTFSLKKGEAPDDDLRPNLFKKNMMPIIVIGAGALLLILLAFVIFSGPGKETDNSRLQAFDARIKQLENKIIGLESGDRRTSEALKRLETLLQAKVKRLDMLEASVAKEMNDLAKKQEAVKVRAAQPPAKKPAPVKPDAAQPAGAKPTAPAAGGQQDRYHVVSAGENLYRISLRYQLKVADLRRLNNLEPDAVIQPGQKLLVAPAAGR